MRSTLAQTFFPAALLLAVPALLVAQIDAGPSVPPASTRPAAVMPAAAPANKAAPPIAPANKPTAPAHTDLVTNVFVDTDLRQALQDIATQVGITIIADPSVTGTISCELKGVSLDKALGIVLAGTGYAVKKTPDYYLVYPPDAKGIGFPTVSKTRRIRLEFASAETVQKLLHVRFREYVNADPATNTVLITATDDLLERIAADIKLLDIAPRHVLLEARIVVLEHNELLNLGVQWQFPKVSAGLFTDSTLNGSWPWGIQAGYTPSKEFTNSLLLTLNLLAQNQEARIAANPQLMAQDGKEAQLRVQTDEYFQITSVGTAFASSQLEKIESGTLLKIVPRIGGADEVTLDMEVEVSDVIARGNSGLPIVNRRTAKSTVRVQDGGTAAIAGLVDTRSQLIHDEVPFVGRLPLIGRLFQNDTNTQASKQVAVFVTATLLEKTTTRPVRSLTDRQLIVPMDAREFRQALSATLERLRKEKQGVRP